MQNNNNNNNDIKRNRINLLNPAITADRESNVINIENENTSKTASPSLIYRNKSSSSLLDYWFPDVNHDTDDEDSDKSTTSPHPSADRLNRINHSNSKKKEDHDIIVHKTLQTLESNQNSSKNSFKPTFFDIDKSIKREQTNDNILNKLLNSKKRKSTIENSSNNNNNNDIQPLTIKSKLQKLHQSLFNNEEDNQVNNNTQYINKLKIQVNNLTSNNKNNNKNNNNNDNNNNNNNNSNYITINSPTKSIDTQKTLTPIKSNNISLNDIELLSPFSPFSLDSSPLLFNSPFKPKGLFDQDSLSQSSSTTQQPQHHHHFSYENKSQNLLDLFQKQQTKDTNHQDNQRKYERLIAIEVNYEIFPGEINSIHKKSIKAYNEELEIYRTIWLFGEWIYTLIHPGDIFNVIGEFDKDGLIVINNIQNLLVLHPDFLITGTELGGSFSCSRRALLKEQISNEFNSTIPLYGSIIHEIFQECLQQNSFSVDDIERFKRDILLQPSFALKLSSLGETHQGAIDHIAGWESVIQSFGLIFIDSQNSKRNIIEIDGEKWHLQITKILDIEENIWSPMYGLKGKIDSSVEIKLSPQFNNQRQSKSKSPNTKKKSSTTNNSNNNNNNNNNRKPIYLNVPFEIKTGKPFEVPYISHTSQVLIYTLMMNDRYNQHTNLGLLYYLKNSKEKAGKSYGIIHPIIPNRNQIRSLMVSRNLLAYYLNQNSRFVLNPNPVLPKMLKEERTCGKCYLVDQCLLHHKAVENGDRFTSGLGDLFDEKTLHLSTSHIEYLKKWNKLISLELESNNNYRKLIWNYPSKFREEKGMCIGSLYIEKEKFIKGGVIYKFGISNNESISNVLLFQGDYVTISIENKYFGVAIGQITNISLNSIKILCREKISEPPTLQDNDFLENQCIPNECKSLHGNDRIKPVLKIEYENDDIKSQELRKKRSKQQQKHSKQQSQLYSPNNKVGISDSRTILNKSRKNQQLFGGESITFRIDKDEGSSSSFLMLKSNLFNLFMPTTSSRLRDLIVDLVPPKFNNSDDNNSNIDKLDFKNMLLNSDQIKAIKNVMLAQDYALILGMPGTGKSNTIAHLVSILYSLGKSVLITSFSHTSLDSLLEKCERAGINKLLRLSSNINQVSPNLQKFCIESNQFISITELKNFLDSHKVVATTCLGTNHAYFNQTRKFDYCIIDEASQLTQPMCFGVLKYCSKFILVGDNYQLPPLVQNTEAKKLGMEESLFKRLSNAFPHAVSYLSYQYRMCSDIMHISNELVYNNRLKCGNEQVASQTMIINCNNSTYPSDSWVYRVCSPSIKVHFINTDNIAESKEQRFGDLFSNSVEAIAVSLIVECLLASGASQSDIGIISPNRIQLRNIKKEINSLFTKEQHQFDRSVTQSLPYSDIDIFTIDKYQGKDKDCIIISMVRNNDQQLIGDLLKDWRRLNVSFTRAKKKLLIVGSIKTLSIFPLYQDLFKILNEKDWIINLDSNIWNIKNK